MNGIGGRTMWYCTTCGGALSVGKALCGCGGKTVPQEVLVGTTASNDTGPLARVRHALADFLGWRDGPR